MQKILTGVLLTAIGVVVFYSAFQQHKSPMRISAKDIPKYGLVMVTPAQPEFEDLKSNLPSEGLLPDQLNQPYVFIKNVSDKRVIAYSINWTLLKDDGRTVTKTKSYSRADLLMGKEAPDDQGDRILLRPGKARLFSLSGYGDGQETTLGLPHGKGGSSDPQVVQKLEQAGLIERANNELMHTVSVTVTLDGAIFEDGAFVGDNVTKLFERTAAKVETKNKMVEDIVRWLAEGATPTDVMKHLQEKAADLKNSDVVPRGDASSEEIQNHHAKRFLDDALGIRFGAGDDELAIRRILEYNKPTHHIKIHRVD
jgi:ribosomal protein S16